MPLLLLLVGVILVVTSIRGTEGQFFTQLESDITGGYLKWAAAIVAIGALGYVPKFTYPSRALLCLVAVVLVVSENGLFTDLSTDLDTTPAPTTTQMPAATNLGSLPVSIGGVTAAVSSVLGLGGSSTGATSNSASSTAGGDYGGG